MSRQNYSVARVVTHTKDTIGKYERHNERKNEHYGNLNVDLSRTPMNVHFKSCGDLTYNEYLDRLVADGKVSLRGLKRDAKVYDEIIFDVNTDYFETQGGYEYAKQFYEETYHFAVRLYGEDNILSAVLHADEINLALSDDYGKPVYHYHMHIVALPVVEKQVLWTKRCKNPELVGTVKEVIQQVSHSKKWKSPQAVDENNQPVFDKNGMLCLSLHTAFCRMNFTSICRMQALMIFSVESVAVPPNTKAVCNIRLRKTRNALRELRKRLRRLTKNCPLYCLCRQVQKSLTVWERKR